MFSDLLRQDCDPALALSFDTSQLAARRPQMEVWNAPLGSQAPYVYLLRDMRDHARRATRLMTQHGGAHDSHVERGDLSDGVPQDLLASSAYRSSISWNLTRLGSLE
jgi:hypothetical protein